LGRGPKETEQPKSRRDGIPFTFQPNVLFIRDQNALKKPFEMKRHLLGFFFEIVERRGYKGYGALNTIFRIAVLKKELRPECVPNSCENFTTGQRSSGCFPAQDAF